MCTGGPCRRQGRAISRKIKSRAEQSDTAFTACLRVLLYNILTCYMLVHNASRTCGDIEGRCQTLPRRRWSGRRKPRFAGSSQRPSALIHNFCIPSRAAFGVASRDPVPVADLFPPRARRRVNRNGRAFRLRPLTRRRARFGVESPVLWASRRPPSRYGRLCITGRRTKRRSSMATTTREGGRVRKSRVERVGSRTCRPVAWTNQSTAFVVAV